MMRQVRWMVLVLIYGCPCALAAWEQIPPMDWTTVKPSDFSDRELDVPYHLEHFHTVANAVVEEGDHRGFLAIKVNREPKDNEPHNARILENNLALAYFYCVDRPWNPYRASSAVRERLEAMLQMWCRIQGPEGYFSEYEPKGWGLAPTGFGVMHMAQTLELLFAKDAPPFDKTTLEKTLAAQRKAIMSILTTEKMLKWGVEYSNQFSGVYRAALSYQQIKPDPEMRAALAKAAKRADETMQSPAGFMYEWGAACVGYSQVHENNLRVAAPMLATDPVVQKIVTNEYTEWNTWLGWNLVLEPDRSGYYVNAGPNSRTSFAFFTGKSRPLSREVEEARCFSMTDQEWATATAEKRAALIKEWPTFKPLKVPSSSAYASGFVMTAIADLDSYLPTAAQKEAAIARLPYLARTNFNHQAFDKFPYCFTFVRRPSYYAAFNSGKIRVPQKQVYGLGLIWSPTMGTVLQSVAQTEWTCGTKLPGENAIVEMSDLKAVFNVAGKAVEPKLGQVDLPTGVLSASYNLPGGGRKSVRFDNDAITVVVERGGKFTEMLPLVKAKEAEVTLSPGVLRLHRGETTFLIEFEANSKVEAGPEKSAGGDLAGTSRLLLSIHGTDKLQYRMHFTPVKGNGN